MSDNPLQQQNDELLDQQGELPPISPADSLSAARSCQAILLILLILTLLVCVVGVVALAR